MTAKGKLTIKRIAELSGVSEPVVSVILKGSKNPTVRFSEDTRKRVLKVVRENGYRPNRSARHLLDKRHGMVGLLVCHTSRIPYLSINWLLMQAARYGMMVTLEHYEYGQKELPLFLREDCVDAVISFEDFGDDLREEFKRVGMPTLWINSAVKKNVNCLLFDERGAMELAVRRFCEQGRQRIILFQRESSHYSVKERVDGIVEASLAAGLPSAEIVLYEEFGVDKGIVRLEEVIKASPEPAGVIINGSSDTLRVYEMARSNGIDIPEQLSVVDLHNHSIGDILDPKPSSLLINTCLLGQQAVDIIMDLVNGKKTDCYSIFPYRFSDDESFVKDPKSTVEFGV